MEIEGTVCTEEARPAAAGTGEGAEGGAGPDCMGAGECEWSTELDYRSYAAEELRGLIRGKEVQECRD